MHTRRDFLRRSSALLPGLALGPGAMLRTALGAPSGAPRNLILIELAGGNDGLNTLVPFADHGGAYYEVFRPTLGVPETDLLKIQGEPIAFAKSCAALKHLFDAGRVAVVQGVGYPQPNFSHEISRRIWHSGAAGGATAGSSQGWLARYLDLTASTPGPCAAEIADRSFLLTEGAKGLVPAVFDVADYAFPVDALYPADALNRKQTHAAIVAALKHDAGPAGAIGTTGAGILDVIELFSAVPNLTFHGAYPNDLLSFSLQTMLRLIKAEIGLRIFHVIWGDFDSHSQQNLGDHHQAQLHNLSQAIAALQHDLVVQGVEHDTLIVVFSEFGRRVYENGSAGTDHGTINPMLVIGSAVNGGLVNAHPPLDPGLLDDHGELPMQADYRDVFGTILRRWYAAPSATVAEVFPGHGLTDLGFLDG